MSDEEQIRRAALDYIEGWHDDKTETPSDVTVVDIHREIASAVVRAPS